jgi:hypothetical protein
MDEMRRIDIFPSGISFETNDLLPSIPENLKYKENTDEFIVQFAGPIKKEWAGEIENMGGSFHQYYRFFAFLVKISPSKISEVRELPYVNWIGNNQPAYKIADGLLDGNAARLMAVHGYDDVDEKELASEFVDMGATVLTLSSDPPIIIINGDVEIISDIAALPEVKAMYHEGVKTPMDSVANEIHKYSHAWYPTWSGLPAPPTSGPSSTALTGRSPGPDNLLYTADDEFEIAGIVDSGFDSGDPNDGHLDFFDSPNGDRIVDYYAATAWAQTYPDGWGVECNPHGTAVAGIINSDGFCWETSPYEGLYPTSDKEWHEGESGVVPEAKLTIAGVPAFSGIGFHGWLSYTGVACNGKPCWDRFYENDGARTISNSWGGIGGYHPELDKRIDKWNDLMILFAAGNQGPSPDTIGESLAKSKNGLTVGASQNYRPNWSESLDPGMIAETSSRGGALTSLGKIKPDIVATGTGVISTMGFGGYLCNRDSASFGNGVPQPEYIVEVDEYDAGIKGPGQDGINDYRYFARSIGSFKINSVTSASTPMAAGGYMQIREYLREYEGINNPTSDLAKALLINGAVRMDENLYDYPGWDQGWGRVNIQESLFPTYPRTNQFIEGNFTNSGSCNVGTGVCSGGGDLDGIPLNTTVESSEVPLKVTLVWIDSSQGEAIVRNLDLKVVSPSGVEFRGNAYNLTGKFKGWSAPNPAVDGVDNPKWNDYWSGPTGWDDVNTVEQVEVDTPEPGIWTVEVIGSSIPVGQANFSVVFSADAAPMLFPSPPKLLSVELNGTSDENVRLIWTLSSDDGAGANNIEAYEIWMSPAYSGSMLWSSLIAEVPAGTNSFTQVGAGSGDTNDYYYIVVARNSDGWRMPSPTQGGKIANNYSSGIKLISIPFNMTSTDLATILNSLDYSIAWWYDPLDTVDHWKTFSPFKSYNDLLTYNRTMALWVEVNSDSYLTVAGMVPDSTSIQIHEGWNLIGYPAFKPKGVSMIFNTIQYERIEAFEQNSLQNLKLLEDNDFMESEGYWVKASAPGTLTFTNP